MSKSHHGIQIFHFIFFCFIAARLSSAFTTILSQHRRRSSSSLLWAEKKIGVFFGTSTGNTEEAAGLICEEFGTDITTEPIDIDTVKDNLAETFSKYSALIVGTPTWNTGADTERSGVGWDEIYYGTDFETLCQDGILSGKKVAVFGCGDSEGYTENYCDAMGEIHDVFQEQGKATMMGYFKVEGNNYEHEASKAQHGDHFVGLALDQVNYDDLSPDRITSWVDQLKSEGFLSEGEAVTPPPAATATPAKVVEPVVAITTTTTTVDDTSTTAQKLLQLEQENAELRRLLQEKDNNNQSSLENMQQEDEFSVIESANDGFLPHYNAVTGGTMWTSSDGRQCYYTDQNKKAAP